MKDTPLLIGLDAGTTNTKAVVFEPDGRVVASASTPTLTHYPAPEWAEYDPEQLWQGAVSAIRQAVEQVDGPGRIAGVAVGSMGETAIPLDARGEPAAPVIAWFDKRAQEQCLEIEARIGTDRLFEITGLPPEPIFGLCKLLWLRQNLPDAYGRVAKWLNVADYLAWRLGAEMATDYSLACRTFMFDLGAMRWSDDMLSATGVDKALLAPLARNGERIGTVSSSAAALTGLPQGCAIAAGGHDHIVAAMASDAVRPGVALSSTGTTEALLMWSDRPARNPALGRAGYPQGMAFVDRPVWYTIGGLFTAGGAVEWFRETMGGDTDYDLLIAEAAEAPPGCLGAGFLPHLRLSTPPNLSATARGAFFGLSTDIRRGHLFRAVLEGIAADTRLCLEGMQRLLDCDPPRVHRVVGGMIRNRLYMEIKAATSGWPLTIVDMPESVAAGAALLGGLAAGIHASLDEGLEAMRTDATVVEPDPAIADLYDRRFKEVYAEAFAQLRPLNRASIESVSGS